MELKRTHQALYQQLESDYYQFINEHSATIRDESTIIKNEMEYCNHNHNSPSNYLSAV